MLDISFGLKTESALIINVIKQVLAEGFRTNDIADGHTNPYKVLGTQDMGKLILKFIDQQSLS